MLSRSLLDPDLIIKIYSGSFWMDNGMAMLKKMNKRNIIMLT